MTDAVRAILDQTESDMRALNLWNYRLKSMQAGNVQRLITDIRAALSEQPAHPAPVERVTLSERRITEIVRSVVSSTERPIGMVAYGELVAHAVIAEYERANGIGKGEQA